MDSDILHHILNTSQVQTLINTISLFYLPPHKWDAKLNIYIKYKINFWIISLYFAQTDDKFTYVFPTRQTERPGWDSPFVFSRLIRSDSCYFCNVVQKSIKIGIKYQVGKKFIEPLDIELIKK